MRLMGVVGDDGEGCWKTEAQVGRLCMDAKCAHGHSFIWHGRSLRGVHDGPPSPDNGTDTSETTKVMLNEVYIITICRNLLY